MSEFLAMSDDDFLKQNAPEGAPAAAAVEEKPAEGTPTVEAQTQEEQGQTTQEDKAPEAKTDEQGTTQTEGDPADTKDEGEQDTAAPGQTTTEKPTTATPEAGPTEKQGAPDGQEGADKSKAPTTEAVVTPNFEESYKKIMAPFKANGKMIELKSPEEAIQLMQMGANYTRKMQELVTHRRVLMMLERNGLLDESKLSFLIDVQAKNPEAIKKLVKDSGIDPLEIDTSVEPAYREGNHRVDDQEVLFQTALDDLKSNQSGIETIKAISTDWDDASKDILFKQPDILKLIHQQRENGIYDRITTEVNRQKTLGMIGPEVSFIQAYKAVGDKLVEQNAFADLTKAPAAPAVATPVATTVAAPKPTVVNKDKAAAASTARPAAPKAKEFINPLAMSDDEFLKTMANRL